ncbi:hypothetical protein KKC32_01730 [Patescibacteria group bacterium]|nr:hypothetical protein [Patescibacteria group bacterium]
MCKNCGHETKQGEWKFRHFKDSEHNCNDLWNQAMFFVRDKKLAFDEFKIAVNSIPRSTTYCGGHTSNYVENCVTVVYLDRDSDQLVAKSDCECGKQIDMEPADSLVAENLAPTRECADNLDSEPVPLHRLLDKLDRTTPKNSV